MRQNNSPGVIRSLKELQPTLSKVLKKKVQKQIEYFEDHQNRMQYRDILQARKAVDKDQARDRAVQVEKGR